MPFAILLGMNGKALRWSLLTSLGLLPLACSGGTEGGTTGGGGGSAGAAGVAGGDGKGLPTCTSPQELAGGFVSCAEGYVYRARVEACSDGPIAGAAGNSAAAFGGAAGGAGLYVGGAAGGAGVYVGGAAGGAGVEAGGAGGAAGGDSAGSATGGTGADAEAPIALGGFAGAGGAQGVAGGGGNSACPGCTGPGASCTLVSSLPIVYACISSCDSDADCGEGSICQCSGGRGTCVQAGCRSDADCESGYHCASTDSICTSSPGPFACQRPADTCRTRADCPSSNNAACVSNPSNDGPRYCLGGACGRPFLVEAQARLAPTTTGSAWLADVLSPRVDHLTTSERSALAEHWSKLGQMEHASIAAFARFSLQLLSLGAPPELVEACTRALADETAHTRLCFALASAYAGRAIGPGLLDVERSLEAVSFVAIVDLVIAEGCFGEASAALEALEAAEAAEDPAIHHAYTRIAADEQRHAELAFRFLRWARERDPNAVAERIAAALASPLAQTPAAREVAVPCLQALLHSGGVHTPALLPPVSQ